MVGLDFSKGLVVCKLVKSPKAVTEFMKNKNSGWGNLQKFPFQLKQVTTIYAEPMQWKDINDFKHWLQTSFGNGQYDDGLYYLLAYRSSLKYVKKGHKRYQKVRPREPFCKFMIKAGSVEMPDDFKTSARSGKTQRVYLLLKKKDELQEAYKQRAHLHRGKIRIRKK